MPVGTWLKPQQDVESAGPNSGSDPTSLLLIVTQKFTSIERLEMASYLSLKGELQTMSHSMWCVTHAPLIPSYIMTSG